MDIGREKLYPLSPLAAKTGLAKALEWILLFQSQSFLLMFLPTVLGLWYLSASSVPRREWVLIASSLIFYGWWDPRFIVLLLAQTVGSWCFAQYYLLRNRQSRVPIIAAIALNLSVLIFFKYWIFVSETMLDLTGMQLPVTSILLPIGISFFTFEIISYLADLAWSKAPNYPLRRFALFVMLFPRLIAGPIVRHYEIIPQFDLDPWREGLAQRVSTGIALLVVGLVKKVFLADNLASIADAGFAIPNPSFQTAWLSVLSFTFQLFLDFSAYSEMAIGIGLLLGFTLPQNFQMPYRAMDLQDFWRRWHMTLSRYLRDYVYIPLGGSRFGAPRQAVAVMATMGLCGLWHGAGWTYVIWGLFHGLGLIACRVWKQQGWPLPAPLAWALTFTFVLAGWVVFRAPNFNVAWNVFSGMAGFNGSTSKFEGLPLLAVAAMVSLIGPSSYDLICSRMKPIPIFAVGLGVAAVAVILAVGTGQPQNFIYFQF